MTINVGEKYLLHAEDYHGYVVVLSEHDWFGFWVKSESDGEEFWADHWELREVE